jgi:hypothetical protein
MGYEIAGGMGVKLAVLAAGEDREVYVMVGDGSYLMLSSELVTAVAESIKLVVVLVRTTGTRRSATCRSPSGVSASGPATAHVRRPGSTATCSPSISPRTRPAWERT